MVVKRSQQMEVIKVCPALFLLKVPAAGISWLFNAWPDATKFLIQQGLELNGIVYPDLSMQTDMGISCNLVEFPLLHALFNQGMLFRGEKPCLVGTEKQLIRAGESFKRGLFGFYNAEEMEDCDLSLEERLSFMREIEGLALHGIQEPEELLEMVPLAPLEECSTVETATEYKGVRIWKEGINVFGVAYAGEHALVDCNLGKGEDYRPPLKLDIKQFPYRLFQIVDTGEEDGFSPKSCMHTLIQWRDRIICVDLPMNVSYLLDQVSVSRTEIDAVIFTHNHDDHIGELSMLLQLDKKVTVICPKVIWKSILLKAATMFAIKVEEFASYFEHVPIRFGEEYDYAGLRILAHPSIHSVPCAVYSIRGIVGQEWKVYGHMSDILNFERCQKLVEDGVITQERFDQYRDFLLAPATVKKIDVGCREGTEDFSVHGSWKDFRADASEHIILGHTRKEFLDEQATVTVGQVAVAGSARDMGAELGHGYQDKYRERALRYLADYLFSLLGEGGGRVERQQVRGYVRILADSEIRLIQPNTPFLKRGGKSTFVDLVISGKGSIWVPQGKALTRIANVNAGDMIGDMGVLLQIPRTASIRSDTYMRVLRIPGFLFREIAILLGFFSEDSEAESILRKIWRHREIVQGSGLFGAEVPLYLQNRIAQRGEERLLVPGEQVFPCLEGDGGIVLGEKPDAFVLEYKDRVLMPEVAKPPVFGEKSFLTGERESYRVVARKKTTVLQLEKKEEAWIRDVPLFVLRLKQLAEKREIFTQRAEYME